MKKLLLTVAALGAALLISACTKTEPAAAPDSGQGEPTKMTSTAPKVEDPAMAAPASTAPAGEPAAATPEAAPAQTAN